MDILNVKIIIFICHVGIIFSHFSAVCILIYVYTYIFINKSLRNITEKIS